MNNADDFHVASRNHNATQKDRLSRSKVLNLLIFRLAVYTQRVELNVFKYSPLRWNRGEYCKSILKEEKASHCTLCTNINSWSRNEHQVGLNAASMHHDHVERMKQRMPSITNQTTPNPIACLTQNANRQNRWSFKPKDRDQLLETFCVVSA